MVLGDHNCPEMILGAKIHPRWPPIVPNMILYKKKTRNGKTRTNKNNHNKHLK
jgi:hypothetical protein